LARVGGACASGVCNVLMKPPSCRPHSAHSHPHPKHNPSTPPRFQRLRKKAGLTVTDTVELYFEQLPASASTASFLGGGDGDGATAAAAAGSNGGGEAAAAALQLSVAELVARQAEYLRASLGAPPAPLVGKPAGSVVIAREETNVGGEQGAVFAAVLAAPAGGELAAAAAAGKVGALALS
jgi:hypothetical protein